MSDINIDEILEQAEERGEDLGFKYAGALLPEEAFALLQADPEKFKLIDVRSQAELDLVGSIPNSIQVEWQTYPDWVANPDFADEINHLNLPDDAILMFICRTGVRSDHAALACTRIGFSQCYNVIEGFEGDKDSEGHRGNVSGWKAKKLPWNQ